MEGTLASISIAPVKGLGLTGLQRAQVTPVGIPENRRFHLLNDRGHLVNNKNIGPLMTVRSEWSEDTGVLALVFPDGRRVEDEVRLGDEVDGAFFGLPRPGRVVEGEFSAALTEFGGRGLRLVQTPPGVSVDRGPDSAISLLSTAGLGDFDARRFRMTFAIDGVPPFAEDGWIGRDVRIGDVVVRPLGVTGRCKVTSMDPDTGERDMDMLEWIRANRPKLPGEPLPFGVHGRVVTPGEVAVGDRVLV